MLGEKFTQLSVRRGELRNVTNNVRADLLREVSLIDFILLPLKFVLKLLIRSTDYDPKNGQNQAGSRECDQNVILNRLHIPRLCLRVFGRHAGLAFQQSRR
jgi:hypothetical protein